MLKHNPACAAGKEQLQLHDMGGSRVYQAQPVNSLHDDEPGEGKPEQHPPAARNQGHITCVLLLPCRSNMRDVRNAHFCSHATGHLHAC